MKLKLFMPTTSIAGGLFMLKRTKKEPVTLCNRFFRFRRYPFMPFLYCVSRARASRPFLSALQPPKAWDAFVTWQSPAKAITFCEAYGTVARVEKTLLILAMLRKAYRKRQPLLLGYCV